MNRFPAGFLADASGYHGGKAASTLNLVPFDCGLAALDHSHPVNPESLTSYIPGRAARE